MNEKNARVRSLAMEELIGKDIKIRKHDMADLVGVEGIVLDETMRTFLIGTPKGRLRVPKKGSEFAFIEGGLPLDVLCGDMLLFRSEDRIKRCDTAGKKKNRFKGQE
ncbi:MAG: ribonuclease P protein subunit [Candidatus Thermoplasmatota archaeon]|nr:ribonuclease P protein subunit [Candidatus Thermoplasmatota archaeon]